MFLTSWLKTLRITCPTARANRTRRQLGEAAPWFRPGLEAMEDRTVPATFTVINTLDSGAGSFRDAITRLNADPQPGIDTITFAIGSGVQTIAPRSALPTVAHPVVIDGTTQPGFAGQPLIELSGASVSGANGLTIDAGRSTIKDLVINLFNNAILLENQGGDTLEGNYFGTDVTGTVALRGGVLITSTSNTVGGTAAGAGNLISGGGGLVIRNSGNNLVQGNFIGTDVTGTKALGNNNGVYLDGGTGSNVIGGTTPAARNLISDNSTGVLIASGSVSAANAGNVVEGNYIGTDITGTKALGNGAGLSITSDSNIIGGTTPAARNIISGNQHGVMLPGSYLGGGGSSGNVVEGNYIGTDVTGTQRIGSQQEGVNAFVNAPNTGPSNVIGGTTPGAGNLISGNTTYGVFLGSNSSVGYNGVVVQGNYIGTDATGTKAVSNGTGVYMSYTRVFTIGGTAPGAGNIIAFNTTYGVVNSGSRSDVQQNAIYSNGPAATPANTTVLTSAVGDNGILTVNGWFTGTGGTTYALEVFSNPAVASGGITDLGSITVTTDVTGAAPFTATLPAAVPTGAFVTAIAAGSSNFSYGAPVIAAAGPVLAVSGFPATTTTSVAGTFTVTARGAAGATLTDYVGTVHFRSSDPKAVLPADYTFTVADHGTHTFTAALKSVGYQFLTAADTLTPGMSGFEVGILVKPGVLVLTGFAAPAVAGVAGTFTATATDADGNVLTGYTGTVHFTSSDPKAVLPPDYFFTAADQGVHTFSATFIKSGPQSLTAAMLGLSGVPLSIQVRPGVPTLMAVSAPSSAVRGTAFSITVSLHDYYGNVVTDYVGTIHFTSSDSTAVLPVNYTFTTADAGVHTFTGLKLNKKGAQTIKLIDTVSPALTFPVAITVS